MKLLRIAQDRAITKSELDVLEKKLDAIFIRVGIDIEFTKHFFERLNDPRNKEQITIEELSSLFNAEFKKYGKELAQLGLNKKDAEAIFKDLNSDINIPFILNFDSRTGAIELISKTIMRKPNFKTPDRVFPV
ncbi:MAG TPA: hypothetical protein ENI23_17680 [bacterium]|nr:hypothetical protein [bacterium]